MRKILLFLFLSCPLFSQVPTFEDTLLVIHYNHAYFKTIPFLKELYSSFPHIVFYGETPSEALAPIAEPFLSEVNLIPTRQGYFLSRVVADALTRYPDYKGYLFIQDDVMLNLWNFNRLDKDKIWFAPGYTNLTQSPPLSWDPTFDKKQTRFEFFNYPRDAWWGWFQIEYGIPMVEKVLPLLSDQDRALLTHNIGEEGRVGMVCDVFYIPQRLNQDAIRLAHIYRDVFCEIAIPMLLSSLDPFENWDLLRGVWGYNPEPTNYPIPDPNYPHFADWVHAMKYSMPYYRTIAKYEMEKHTP